MDLNVDELIEMMDGERKFEGEFQIRYAAGAYDAFKGTYVLMRDFDVLDSAPKLITLVRRNKEMLYDKDCYFRRID